MHTEPMTNTVPSASPMLLPPNLPIRAPMGAWGKMQRSDLMGDAACPSPEQWASNLSEYAHFPVDTILSFLKSGRSSQTSVQTPSGLAGTFTSPSASQMFDGMAMFLPLRLPAQ